MTNGLNVFISYKSEQRSWALRLADDLGRYGYEVFVDRDPQRGLRPAEDWRPQLKAQIEGADHFLVLWSSDIPASSYVVKEVNLRLAANRPVHVVKLDESAFLAEADSGRHHFLEFIPLYTAFEAHEAPKAAGQVRFFAWQEAVRGLVDRVLEKTDPAHRIVEIPFIVVAMTRQQALQVRDGTHIAQSLGGDVYGRLMALLGESAPLDPDRYGEQPEDWRPFAPSGARDAEDPTVEELVFRFDREERQWLRDHPADAAGRARPHVFLSYGAALRASATSQKARDVLRDKPSLIVLDPISLVHRDVHGFVMQNGLHLLQKAFQIGVGPRIASSLTPVQTYFTEVEQDLFDRLMMIDPHRRSRSYYRPTLSTCVLNVEHGFELSKWLNLASESIVSWVVHSENRPHPGYGDQLRQGPLSPPQMSPRSSW